MTNPVPTAPQRPQVLTTHDDTRVDPLFWLRDVVKYWLQKSLASSQPAHVLLAVPPATAKSPFLEALGILPGAQYSLGGSSSLAGIADFLINFRPRYLIDDELDNMEGEDFSVLLSLMQSVVVARLKKGMREVDQMTTWIFAGVNRRDRLPLELMSEFLAVANNQQVRLAIQVTKLWTPKKKWTGLRRAWPSPN